MPRVVVPLLVLASLALGCSSDGGDDLPADGGAFTLSSEAFDEGDDIPVEHARDGDDRSPPLEWSGVPDSARELAITVLDPDASNFVHWTVWGLPAESGAIDAGQVPADAVEGLNQLGEPGWAGPSPPSGEEHTYVFRVHALERPLGIPPDTPALEAVAAIEQLTIETAELRAQYGTG